MVEQMGNGCVQDEVGLMLSNSMYQRERDRLSSGSFSISDPFIDKFSITFLASGNDHILCSTDSTSWGSFLIEPWRQKVGSRYHYGWKVIGPDRKHLLCLQHTPIQGMFRNTRLDFNPANIPDDIVPELSTLLNTLLDFSCNHEGAYGGAVITRIDYALDISGRHIDELLIHVPYKRHVHTSRTTRGETESIYFGSRKSSNHLLAYDKAKESGLIGAVTRLEYREKGKVSLSRLAEMRNPFDGIRIFDLVTSADEAVWGEQFPAFVDSCRYRSYLAALKVLPRRQRRLYREWLDSRERMEFRSPDWWPRIGGKQGKVLAILGVSHQ